MTLRPLNRRQVLFGIFGTVATAAVAGCTNKGLRESDAQPNQTSTTTTTQPYDGNYPRMCQPYDMVVQNIKLLSNIDIPVSEFISIVTMITKDQIGVTFNDKDYTHLNVGIVDLNGKPAEVKFVDDHLLNTYGVSNKDVALAVAAAFGLPEIVVKHVNGSISAPIKVPSNLIDKCAKLQSSTTTTPPTTSVGAITN